MNRAAMLREERMEALDPWRKERVTQCHPYQSKSKVPVASP